MLNINKSFGLNVIPNKQNITEYTGEIDESEISGILEPLLGYLKDNDNVFSGQVEEEIERMNYALMRLGMTLNNGNPKRRLNYEG